MPAKRPIRDHIGRPSAVERIRPAGDSAGTTAQDAVTSPEPLEEEIAFYLQHLREWKEHESKHVLIRGPEQFGFYPTRDEALLEGFRRFGRVSFLVKQVLLE